MYIKSPPGALFLQRKRGALQEEAYMDLVKTERKFNEQIKNVQLAIKLLVLVIFLGYMMIWIMMPTNIFWLHWLPRIHAATASTYFGEQGLISCSVL